MISVALKVQGQVTSKQAAMERFRMPEAIHLFTQTLQEAGCCERDIHEIRVGRGPGNYTGIRQSLALAIGLSVPSSLPLRVVSSGSALFYGPEMDQTPGWVLGDARRGEWWGAWVSGSSIEWKTDTPERWRETLRGHIAFSAEPHRLEGVEVTAAVPKAESLLHIAEDLFTEPAEPLYLHQAV
jgi:tRNA A37 threonylcarbamoyladenosine modification protein TsaB